MDVVDCCVHNLVFADALALFHDLYDHRERGKKPEMDGGLLCRAGRRWDVGVFLGGHNSANIWLGIKEKIES